eukprot:scaffold15759_cov174-Amphora_coffeaeformis.AAC.1
MARGGTTSSFSSFFVINNEISSERAFKGGSSLGVTFQETIVPVVGADLGMAQILHPPGSNNHNDIDELQVRQLVAEARHYVQTVVQIEPRYEKVRQLCRNLHPGCAFFAVSLVLRVCVCVLCRARSFSLMVFLHFAFIIFLTTIVHIHHSSKESALIIRIGWRKTVHPCVNPVMNCTWKPNVRWIPMHVTRGIQEIKHACGNASRAIWAFNYDINPQSCRMIRGLSYLKIF